MRIFLICKVRGVVEGDEEWTRQDAYVRRLEEVQGATVHWPWRNTLQDDHTRGFNICRTTFWGIFRAKEVHIIWDPTSEGRIFDLGIVFALNELVNKNWFFRLLIGRRKVHIVNRREVDRILVEKLMIAIHAKDYIFVAQRLEDNSTA